MLYEQIHPDQISAVALPEGAERVRAKSRFGNRTNLDVRDDDDVIAAGRKHTGGIMPVDACKPGREIVVGDTASGGAGVEQKAVWPAGDHAVD